MAYEYCEIERLKCGYCNKSTYGDLHCDKAHKVKQNVSSLIKQMKACPLAYKPQIKRISAKTSHKGG